MARLADPRLVFEGSCPDCARRVVELPAPLPGIRDDFPWDVRDYDAFRMFMLEELAARFPDRTRWTPADVEVVLVEAVSAVLDQYSDMLDRVANEAFLETARRPESVRRLLDFIGYPAVREAQLHGLIEDTLTGADARRALESYWLANPSAMDEARQEGPRRIHVQYRMATIEDYAEQLEQHALIRRAQAEARWTGSWTRVHVALITWNNVRLDAPLGTVPTELRDAVEAFHLERELPAPSWEPSATLRGLLQPVVDACRMQGQEVVLEDALLVPVTFSLSIQVGDSFFQSETRRAVEDALGTGPGGFFEPGRLRFGEDLYVSDLLQVLTALDGVQSVCVNRFKRLGQRFADRAAIGHIVFEGLEVAICENDPLHPESGYYRLWFHGGLPG